MAFHIPSLTSEDTPALDLAAVILGQGESSRLSRKVKQERQLVTTAYAYAYTPRDPGLLVIGATTTPARLLKAIQALATEALALGKAEVSADELRRAKTLIESEAVYQKETVQGQARKLGFFQTVTGAMAFEQEYYRRIAEITPRQLRRVAARYLRPDKVTLSVVGPGLKGRQRQVAKDIKDAVRVANSQLLDVDRARVDKSARVVKATLPNGARLLVMQDRTVPLVAMRAVWMGGLRYEDASTNGINSLLAALITRGTTSRSADQISETIEGMAGSIGGFSGQNSFGARAELLSRHWEQGLEILADCLLNPAFEPKEVEHQRRLLLDDILAQEDNLSSVVMRLFSRTMYKRHPYKMDVLGTVESVSALTRDQLARYYHANVSPSQMVMAVVGDVEPQQVQAKLGQLFGSIPPQPKKKVSVPREPPRREAEEAFQFVNKQQAHLVVGYPGATLRGKDRFALEVMASVMSGQGGRLFLELRDRLGLAYQVGAYSQEGLEPGFVAVYIATSTAKVQQALSEIDKQVQRLKSELVSQHELKRIKRYLVGTFEISLQRRSTMASYLAFNECYGMGYRAYSRYSPSILAVTAEDVRRVARRYLSENKRVVTVVQPEQRSPGADQQLGKRKRAGTVRTTKSPVDAGSSRRTTRRGRR
jgi:zinc protease